MNADDPRHGSTAGYSAHMTDGEHPCNACRSAKNAYAQHAERQAAYGRWNPWVDADLARQHVAALMAGGTSIKRIAEAAGVQWQRVGYLMYGRGEKGAPAKVRPDFAALILGVEPNPRKVSVLGLQRRIQGLVALGYTQPWIAAHLGCTQGRVWQYLAGAQERVTRERFDAVAALYDRYSMTLPPTRTTAEKYAVSRSRNTAMRNGYLPPLVWDEDEIDNPHAAPLSTGYEPIGLRRGTELLDEWRHLRGLGVSEHHATQQLGVTIDAIEKAIERERVA